LQHVARGADGALFFQWRAARAGAEKFHSAMLPHGGTDTKVWRETCELGRVLGAISEVCDSVVDGVQVAILHDTDARWAAELDSHPSVEVSTIAETRRWHDALWRAGVTADFRQSTDDLSGYPVVIVPVQYLVTDESATALAEFVRAGGHLVMTYFSGIVDVNDHIRLGGYPGAFAEMLGIRIEEFYPLHAGETVPLSRFGAGSVWAELGRTTGAETLAEHTGGPVPGSPAVTRNRYGAGTAYYVGTALDRLSIEGFVAEVLTEAGVTSVLQGLRPGVEAVRRRGEHGSWTFVINHTDTAAEIAIEGHELINDAALGGTLTVAAGGVAVVRA
jgi:beta-galactosidase